MNNFERNAILNGPLPKNDPKLFEKVSCRAMKSFYLNGCLVGADSIVDLEKHLADSLAATGKIKFL